MTIEYFVFFKFFTYLFDVFNVLATQNVKILHRFEIGYFNNIQINFVNNGFCK